MGKKGKSVISVLMICFMLYSVFLGVQGETPTPVPVTPTPKPTPVVGFKVPIQLGVDFDYGSQNTSKVMSGFKVTFKKQDLNYGGGYVITNDSGYTAAEVVIGYYDITISKSNYLEKTIKNVWIYPGTSIGKFEPVIMQAGDLTRDGVQDGVVNMADIMELAKFFNKTSSDVNYNTDCDYNGDGAVNLADVMITAKNFNKTVDTLPVDISGDQISITYPKENYMIPSGTKLTIKTNVILNESISKVEFFADYGVTPQKVGEDTQSPYDCEYTVQHYMSFPKELNFFAKMTTSSGLVYRSNNAKVTTYIPTPTPILSPPSAARTLELEAESYNESAGVINNGTYITCNDQSMIVYKNVNLNRFPAPFTDSLAVINVSVYAKNIPASSTSTVEFRLDGKEGILLGAVDLNSNTSNEFSIYGKRFNCWNNYNSMTSRYHDLYLVFKGASQVGDFDKFNMNFSYIIGPTPTPTPTPTPLAYTELTGYSVINDGKMVITDVAPIEYHEEVLLPVRTVAECLLVNVNWDASSNTITFISSQGDEMVMTVNKTEYTINGMVKTMKSPVIVVGGRTMVPAKVVVEEFGGLFTVDATNKTISIY